MQIQKVLVFDIETSPIIASVWDTRDVNIANNQIKVDWRVIAWAAKWLNAPAREIMYMDQRKAPDMMDDKFILGYLWKLLDEADIVVTQNGKNFDTPKLNARFIEFGWPPPSPYRHLDTYQIARHVAKFTSNKLEYLTEKLCKKYRKLTHKKFPGQELWTGCLNRNQAAWKEMEKYNKHDVLATEELYGALRAWAPQNAPSVYIVDDEARQCRICGKVGTMISKGLRITKKAKYRRYTCTNCGSVGHGGKI